MKRIYFLLVAVVLTLTVNATTYAVNVANYSFSPDNLNVNVGDTIKWMWLNGSHTTTSTTIPLGAIVWDTPLNQNTETFSYVVSVAGTYNYQCTPHHQMGMVAQFTALENSVNNLDNPVLFFNVTTNPVTNNMLSVDLNTKATGMCDLTLNDITGRNVRMLLSGIESSGEHHFEYDTEGLSKGIYILMLQSNEKEFVRKVILN